MKPTTSLTPLWVPCRGSRGAGPPPRGPSRSGCSRVPSAVLSACVVNTVFSKPFFPFYSRKEFLQQEKNEEMFLQTHLLRLGGDRMALYVRLSCARPVGQTAVSDAFPAR